MTVKETIDAKVKAYWKIYQSFKKDPEFKDKAESLALYDLVMQKYVAERAIEELEAKIKKEGA